MDYGIGIPKSEQNLIFTPFFKSETIENIEMNPAGNGLGLFIARNICRSLGGDLIVRSSKGCHAIFTMTMAFEIIKNDF